ncbi:TolC family protein [bacterium]|nr:TolC family protein [bacterium]
MLTKAACVLCLCLFLCVSIGTARAETISISFQELDSLARSQSPGSRIIEYEFSRTLADRDQNLQWTNPEIGYDLEDVDPAREYQVTIGKQFAMPWAYLKKRSAWNERVHSATLLREAQRVEHLADLKAGYVAARVHQQYLIRLEQLRSILTDASHVATSRHTEGHLSGIEEHLIQMTVISLNASYQSATQQQREALAFWRAAMGFAADDSLILTTVVDYHKIELQPASQYVGMIESQPRVRAKVTMHEALTKQASAERAAFIPSLNLYGGYKKIDPDYDGYVAGVSLSLPLFNRNGANARMFEAESNIAANEAALYRNQVAGKVKALTRSITESQTMLATVADHFEEDLEALNNLLYSYEEGWLTLSELLNAIQIETAGLEDYYHQLIRYFENLFELEALTGASLVRF